MEKGCIAPGEILDVLDPQSRLFGKVAEEIIYTDLIASRAYSPLDVYVDNHRTGYLDFIEAHNPKMRGKRDLFTSILADSKVPVRRPDLLIHTPFEKVFYEIKPESTSGGRKGITKAGELSATYKAFNLPYTLGMNYKGCSVVVASMPGVKVTFKARLKGPGLIVYQLCLDAGQLVDIVIISIILRYVIGEMIKQSGKSPYQEIDLRPAFAREGQLANFAQKLGLVMAAAAATTVVAAGTAVVVKVGWSFFWKAVAKRFAARGALALFLAGSTGPLPVGELLAAGMTIWMIVDVIRLSSTLWTEAAQIARDGA